jgi:hypothetical protein
VLLPEELALLDQSPVPAQTALTMIGSLISNSRMAIDSKTHMVRGGGGITPRPWSRCPSRSAGRPLA